jgi:hypothetical protein
MQRALDGSWDAYESNSIWIDSEAFFERLKSMLPLQKIAVFLEAHWKSEASVVSGAYKRLDELLLRTLSGCLLRRSAPNVPHVTEVAYCHHHWLPETLRQRIELLFRIVPRRWIKEDLQEYIEPILDPGATFEGTIAKYCREYRVPGQPTKYALL